MQLVAFSVTNYRSITTAYKLPVRQSTILIGPNNEGKSNILRALVTALEFLSSLGGIKIQGGRLRQLSGQPRLYEWETDFPISLQNKHPDGQSIFSLAFRPTAEEIAEFYSEVGSTLDGNLPIQLSLDQKGAGFKVTKKGPGAQTLSKKAEAIAKFVARRIHISYIPAVRTAKSAEDIVTDLVERELAAVESNSAYRDALAAVAEIQKPVLDRISASIRETLREFLPKVTHVKVTIPEEARFRALRRACEIVVDDGTPTLLGSKGDGVQSLAALSLMRHASEGGATNREIILAVEEPESHLHPSAIHQLKSVLAEIARKHQVIMTTHCPLFVDRTNLRSNIVVHNRRAAPAKDVQQIRDILGVRASDNLRHAELVLLVEREEDKRALAALLKHSSTHVATALAQNALAIDSLLGGSNLSYKLSQVREAMCLAHCLLDHDKCGLDAANKAEREGLMTLADATFTIWIGMQESEIEDLYDQGVYAGMLLNRYGVSTQSPKFKGAGKWSDRLARTFRHQGKPRNDCIEAKVKSEVSELVVANPSQALNPHKRDSVDALVQALEGKLRAISDSKK